MAKKTFLTFCVVCTALFSCGLIQKGYAMSDRRYLNGERLDTAMIDLENPARNLEENLKAGDRRFIRVCGFVCTYPGIDKDDNALVEKYGNKMIGGSTDMIPEGASQYAEQYNKLLLEKLRKQ